MPSSDITMVPKVMAVMEAIGPGSILDIGVGNGRYGFLFRECLDWNFGRLKRPDWIVTIDGVEIAEDYITDIHRAVYNDIIVSDWLEYVPEQRTYSVAFMGDVLEHWPDGDWQQALYKARDCSKFTVVVAPNWRGSIAQGVWNGFESESHRVVLSPQKIGGRCLHATSKMFMCVFDNYESGLLEGREVCL